MKQYKNVSTDLNIILSPLTKLTHNFSDEKSLRHVTFI